MVMQGLNNLMLDLELVRIEKYSAVLEEREECSRDFPFVFRGLPLQAAYRS